MLAVTIALVRRDYETVLRLTPERLPLEALADGMTQTGEVFVLPEDKHLDDGFQLSEGPGAELFVPLKTAEGQADLEVQFQVAENGRLVLWDILVP